MHPCRKQPHECNHEVKNDITLHDIHLLLYVGIAYLIMIVLVFIGCHVAESLEKRKKK